MHVTVSTTNTVFSVCVACKKVPENFAEIKDVSFLLRRMFLGCGSYCWSIFERLECKITWRKEILLSALGCNAEHVVVPLTLNSLPGFLLLTSAFFICLYFWSDVIFFQLRQHKWWFQCEGNPDLWIRPMSSEHNEILSKDLCTPLTSYFSCCHMSIVLKPYLFSGISCLSSCA